MKEELEIGADRAVYQWLCDHPISAHDAIQDGIAKAAAQWLEEHKDKIIEEIAKNANK